MAGQVVEPRWLLGRGDLCTADAEGNHGCTRNTHHLFLFACSLVYLSVCSHAELRNALTQMSHLRAPPHTRSHVLTLPHSAAGLETHTISSLSHAVYLSVYSHAVSCADLTGLFRFLCHGCQSWATLRLPSTAHLVTRRHN